MLGLCFLRFFVCTKCSLAFFSSVCCKLDVVGSGSSDGCAFLVSESSSPRPHGPGRKLLLSSLYSPITRRELDVGGDKRWRKLHRQLWCAQVSQVVLPVSKLLFIRGESLVRVLSLGRRRLPFWEGRGVEKTEPCQVVCSGTRKQELGFIYNVRSIARGSVGALCRVSLCLFVTSVWVCLRGRGTQAPQQRSR